MKTQKKNKPHFVAYVASSIDGRIALNTLHQPDWTSSEDWKFFQRELGNADAVVVGRNTFKTVEKRLQKRNTFVLTSKVKTTLAKDSVVYVNPKTASLSKLLSEYKSVAVVGGASVYQTMLDKDLLDELYVTIEPLVFGRGRPMFEGGLKNHVFTLVSQKKLNSRGSLLLRYRIAKNKKLKNSKKS